MCGVSKLLGVDRSPEGLVTVLVCVRVVRWVGDDFVARRVLMLEKFLQGDDARQDQSQLSDDQGFERDQREESDCERQECSSLQLEQQEEWQQVLLALLGAFASCTGREEKKRDCYEIRKKAKTRDAGARAS